MKKKRRVTGTASACGSVSSSASRRRMSATVPESRPRAMRALGCGSANPPPTGAMLTPPFAQSLWLRNRRSAGVTPGSEETIRAKTPVTSAAATSRQIPPERSSGSIAKPVAKAGVTGREEASLRRPAPAPPAQFATCARSNRSLPPSGVCGRPSRRIQSSTTFSDTPNDSAIWIRFKYIGEGRSCRSWAGDGDQLFGGPRQARDPTGRWPSAPAPRPRSGRSRCKAGTTGGARAAGAAQGRRSS
jgi:hypothetical protein